MKRTTSRPEDHGVFVFSGGTKSTYDLPPEVLDQLRLASILRNRIVQRFRDLDDRCAKEKSDGRDHKVFRKEFIAAHGRPDDPAWANAVRKEIGLGAAVAAEVIKHVAEANGRVVAARLRGEPASLNPKSFDGTGTAYKQVKEGIAGGAAIEKIENGGCGGLRIEQSCKRDDRGRETDTLGHDAVFHFTVYPGVKLSVPVPDYFRPQKNNKNRIPAGSTVTAIRISRKREGRHFRCSVAVTYWAKNPEPAQDTFPLVLTTGWANSDGNVRVANISGSIVPPSIPPEILLAEGWIYPDGDGGYDIELPARIRQRIDHTDRISSYRDDELNRIRPLLAEATGLARWASLVKSVDKVNSFVRSLDLGPDHDLEKWRREDAHHGDYESGQRGQLVNRRRDSWRKLAAWIAEQGRPVMINKPEVAEIRRKKPEDSFPAQVGRKNIQKAAPAEFVALVTVACKLRGVSVIDAKDEK